MITELKYIPVTEKSYPFQTAVNKCEFEKIGYIEDEYFMSGLANVYTETGVAHDVKELIKNVPYTTRILIRRPKDIKKFSGNVVVEILNASAMMDIDRIWVNTWKYMTRNGDIYVGITSKGHVVDTLKRFDKERYAEINWNNPDRTRTYKGEDRFGFLEEYESGLYWDMQTDLAKLLRKKEPENPIYEYGKNYLYLAGWSQSASYVARTLSSFSYRKENIENGPLFDGYFHAGLDDSLAPINSYEHHTTDGRIFSNGVNGKYGMLISKEPLITINTESENRGANWGEDSDEVNRKFRSYQIVGSSHDSYYNLIEYYEGHLLEDATRANFELKFNGIDGKPLDLPYEYVFHAALRNLYKWVREEIPAPRMERIKMIYNEESFDPMFGGMNKDKLKYENEKDVLGNSVGGIRLAVIEYPIGKYKSYSNLKNGTHDPMFGTVYPFDEEMLKGLYGDCVNYRMLSETNAEKLISQGILLREDKDEYVEKCVAIARKYGLK